MSNSLWEMGKTECNGTMNDGIVHKGWMKMKSKTLKRWKKRWFELHTNNSLIYYEESGENKVEIGNICLCEMIKFKTKQSDNGFKIKLVVNTETVAYFRLKYENDYNSWHYLLESRVNPKAIFEGY